MLYKARWFRFLLLLLVLGVVAVLVLPRGLLLARIAIAKTQWQSQQISNYRMSIQSASAWSMANMELEVRDGRVVNSSCTSEGMPQGCDRVEFQQLVIPELFNTADTNASFFAHRDMDGNLLPCFSVDVDSTYHYPATMRFDCPNTLDEEWILRVLSFEPLP